VPCLPGELNQVILNMIVNAAHAIADVVGDGANGKGTITIRTRKDVMRLAAAGIDGILVGEALMGAPDIGARVRELSGRQKTS